MGPEDEAGISGEEAPNDENLEAEMLCRCNHKFTTIRVNKPLVDAK